MACLPGFQSSLTVIVYVCSGSASESLLFPAAVEGKVLPSFMWLGAAHSQYQLQATGAFPTGRPGNPDNSNVGQRAACGQR